MKKNYFSKKLRIWSLILKNGLGIITKFKIPLLIFLLITIIFSLTISSFIEINVQLNNQINKSDFTNQKINKTYSIKETFLNNQKNRNIFCNDFTELKINNEIKRFPYYSFGDNGCFKKIEKNEIKINYLIDKETNQILSVNNIWIDSKNFLINYNSNFYKNSIHQKLIEKYKETSNIDYKNLANKLINEFLKNDEIGIKKILKENIKKQINIFLKNNEIYLQKNIEKQKFNEINIDNIILSKKNIDTLNNYLEKIEEKEFEKNELIKNKESILKDWKEFWSFLQEIKNKKLDSIFKEINTKQIKEEIKKSIGNKIKKIIISYKKNELNKNEINLNFDENNKLKISDFNEKGEIIESSLNKKEKENNEDYLKRLINIKSWVKKKEGKIINFFKTEILNIIKKESEDLLLTDSTKETLNSKINNIFLNTTNTINTFKYFLDFFVNTMEDISLNNKNKTNKSYEKWKNYLLSNYSNFKKMINEKLLKNELINFWKQIKKIEELYKELNITTNENIILNNISFNNIKTKPIKYQTKITEKELDKYIKWLEYRIFIKNSIFNSKDNDINIKNYITALNEHFLNLNENLEIKEKDFLNLIPDNYNEFKNKYSKKTYEKILEIVNKIKEKEYILNFWKNKIINNFEKLINWRQKYWFLFQNIDYEKENLSDLLNIKIKPLKENVKNLNILDITDDNFEETKDWVNNNTLSTKTEEYNPIEFLFLWRKHNTFKSKLSLKNAKFFIKFGSKFLNKIFKEIFKEKFENDNDLNLNMENWSSNDNNIIKNAQIVDKWIKKFSINIFDSWNLLNLMQIQKSLISSNPKKKTIKDSITTDFQKIKEEFKKKFIEFTKTISINEKIELIQKKPSNYENWITNINEKWKSTYPNDNKNNNIDKKINYIFSEKELDKNKRINLKEKIKERFKSLKKLGFDLNKKEFKIETQTETFFINKIINSLINSSKNQIKNLFHLNLKFIPNFSKQEKNIKQRITEILIAQKNNEKNLGFQNSDTFKNNYLNNIFFGKEFNFSSVLKNNQIKLKTEFEKYIKNDPALKELIKKIEFNFYNKKNKKIKNEIIGIFEKLTYTLKSKSNDLTKNQKNKIKEKIINWEKKIIENNIENLNYWFDNNNVINDFISINNNSIIDKQWKIRKRTDLLHEIIAKINNVKYKRIYSTWAFDAANNINWLIIQNGENDNSFKLHLVEGSAPLQSNEVVITPTYAKEKNIKIGDSIKILEKNLKIIGFGSQTPFIFPAGNWQNPLDVKDNVIIYVNSKFQNSILWYLKNLTTPLQIMKYHHVFLEGSDQNIKNFEKDLLINKESFTKFSLENENKENGKHQKKYKIIDEEYLNLRFQNFDEKLDGYNYSLLNQFVNTIQVSMNWTSIVVCLIIFFVWLFSAFNLITRKIKESKLQISFLKAQGIKGNEILFTYFGLLPPLFLSIIFGIFLGFFFQNPIFNKLQEYLSLKFDSWNVSTISVITPLLIIPIILMLFIFIMNWWAFEKRKIFNLINNIEQTISGFWENKFKNFIIKKMIPKNKIMIKINFIFFLTIWKKVIILFCVIFFFSINLIGTIYLLRLPTTTTETQFKTTKHNYNIELKTPAANNPFSFYHAYAVEGIEGLKKRIKNNEIGLYPIEKFSHGIYTSNDKGKKYNLYWKVGLKTDEPWKNFETFHTPIFGHTFNMEYMKRIFNGLDEKNREQFCELIKNNVLKNQLTKNNKKTCIEELEQLSIPFKTNFSKEENEILKRQLPVQSQKFKYDKKNDVLSTTIEGRLNNNKKQTFKIIGIKKNNYVFEHDWKTELSKPNKDGEINVVVNQRFLDEYKLKIGDIFNGKYKRKLLYFKNKKEPYKKEDWKYLPIGKDINSYEKTEEESVWDWNKNSKLYKGSLVNELKDFKVNINTGQIQKRIKNSNNWEKITFYNKYYDEISKTIKYTEMIDIERVLLYQNKNESIRIFLGNELKYGNNLLKRARNWWEWNVKKRNLYTKEEWVTPKINGETFKFKITNKINTYKKPEIYIEQEKVNQIVGFYNLYKNKDYVGDSQYFNSLYSRSKNMIDAVLFGILISDPNGYLDIDTIEGVGISKKLNINIGSSLITKNSIYIFLEYILSLVLFSIILNIISSLFLLWFILKGIFEEFQKLTVDLKIFGYSNKELLKQVLIIMILPIIFGFLFASIIVKITFNNFILLAKEHNFYLFLDEGFWIFLVTFLIIIFCFIFISWKYIQGFKNFNFNEYLRV